MHVVSVDLSLLRIQQLLPVETLVEDHTHASTLPDALGGARLVLTRGEVFSSGACVRDKRGEPYRFFFLLLAAGMASV